MFIVPKIIFKFATSNINYILNAGATLTNWHKIMNTKKFSKKVVNVENFESGNQALTIYEIRVHVIRDDKDWTADRYLNKEDAEKAIEYYKEVHKNLYDLVWMREQLVWCK